MKGSSILLVLSLSLAAGAQERAPAQAVIRPGDNFMVESIPPIPASVAEKAN